MKILITGATGFVGANSYPPTTETAFTSGYIDTQSQCKESGNNVSF